MPHPLIDCRIDMWCADNHKPLQYVYDPKPDSKAGIEATQFKTRMKEKFDFFKTWMNEEVKTGPTTNAMSSFENAKKESMKKASEEVSKKYTKEGRKESVKRSKVSLGDAYQAFRRAANYVGTPKCEPVLERDRYKAVKERGSSSSLVQESESQGKRVGISERMSTTLSADEKDVQLAFSDCRKLALAQCDSSKSDKGFVCAVTYFRPVDFGFRVPYVDLMSPYDPLDMGRLVQDEFAPFSWGEWPWKFTVNSLGVSKEQMKGEDTFAYKVWECMRYVQWKATTSISLFNTM